MSNLRAIVVDGGSGDGSADELAAVIHGTDYRDWASFLPLPINGGFGWANNQAILTLAREPEPPEFIYLLNPDAEVTEEAIAKLAEELQSHPRCGAAGSMLLTPDGRTAASAFRFPSISRDLISAVQSGTIGRLLRIGPSVVVADDSTEVDWVTGASVMFRAQALRETGLFDDGFFLYFEEVELLYRLQARGWTVRHVPSSRVVHIEGASTKAGPSAATRPLPGYWYQSHRRYFGLTSGRAAVLGANLSLLGGLALGGMKRIVGRTPANRRYRMRDLLTLGFWPKRSDTRPSVPNWGDPPGRPPAWMSR